MLVRNFFLGKRQFFYALFARQIFLSYDYICFMNVLSFKTKSYHDFRLLLKKNNISIFFFRSSFLKYVFSNPKFFNFMGAHCFILYTNSFVDFFNVLDQIKDNLFLMPYAFLFKNNLLSISSDFLDIYKNLFLKHNKFQAIFIQKIFSKIFLYFSVFSVFSVFLNVFRYYFQSLRSFFFFHKNTLPQINVFFFLFIFFLNLKYIFLFFFFFFFY